MAKNFSAIEDEKLIKSVAKHPSLYDHRSPFYKDQIVKENAWREVEFLVGKSATVCKVRWKIIKNSYFRRKKRSIGMSNSILKKWPLEEMLSFLGTLTHEHKSVSNTDESGEPINMSMIKSGKEDEDICTGNSEELSEHSESQFKTADYSQQSALNQENNVYVCSSTDEYENGSQRPKKRCRNTKREKFNQGIIDMLEERNSDRNNILSHLLYKEEDSIDLFLRSVAVSLRNLRPELVNETKIRILQVVGEMEHRQAIGETPTSEMPEIITSFVLDS